MTPTSLISSLKSFAAVYRPHMRPKYHTTWTTAVHPKKSASWVAGLCCLKNRAASFLLEMLTKVPLNFNELLAALAGPGLAGLSPEVSDLCPSNVFRHL